MTHAPGGDRQSPHIAPPPTDQELEVLAHDRQIRSKPDDNDWATWSSSGNANVFHHYRPDHAGHEIWIRNLHRPALILGSTQSAELIKPGVDELNVELCRRRSGGGLVHLDPTLDVWIDILVPSGSPLWEDDVARSFNWLGHLWAQVLDDLLPNGQPMVHNGPSRGSDRALCFAGLGHGEVTVSNRKIVGLSQRRTRNWIRLQCAVIQQWPGAYLWELLGRPGSKAAAGNSSLPDPRTVHAGLEQPDSAVAPRDVVAAFVESVTSRVPAQLLSDTNRRSQAATVDEGRG